MLVRVRIHRSTVLIVRLLRRSSSAGIVVLLLEVVLLRRVRTWSDGVRLGRRVVLVVRLSVRVVVELLLLVVMEGRGRLSSCVSEGRVGGVVLLLKGRRRSSGEVGWLLLRRMRVLVLGVLERVGLGGRLVLLEG